MANTPANGNGPFEFTTAAGKQISIPLSAFSFDVGGNLIVDPAWQSYTNVPPGSLLLTHAVKEGLLTPRPLPSPFAAMIVKAADPGTGGNNIMVAVSISSHVASPPSTDPNLVEFSLTVTETDNYTGLTPATIESVLGSSAMQGTSPGLVQIVHGSVNPAGILTTIVTASLTGSPAQYTVLGSGSPPTLFTLVSKKAGADAILTRVTLTPNLSSPPGANTPTFNLRASWTKTIGGITLATLESMVSSGLGYEITVSKPGSGAYSVPAAGTTQLSGGGPGSVASATLFTS